MWQKSTAKPLVLSVTNSFPYRLENLRAHRPILFAVPCSLLPGLHFVRSNMASRFWMAMARRLPLESICKFAGRVICQSSMILAGFRLTGLTFFGILTVALSVGAAQEPGKEFADAPSLGSAGYSPLASAPLQSIPAATAKTNSAAPGESAPPTAAPTPQSATPQAPPCVETAAALVRQAARAADSEELGDSLSGSTSITRAPLRLTPRSRIRLPLPGTRWASLTR